MSFFFILPLMLRISRWILLRFLRSSSKKILSSNLWNQESYYEVAFFFSCKQFRIFWDFKNFHGGFKYCTSRCEFHQLLIESCHGQLVWCSYVAQLGSKLHKTMSGGITREIVTGSQNSLLCCQPLQNHLKKQVPTWWRCWNFDCIFE